MSGCSLFPRGSDSEVITVISISVCSGKRDHCRIPRSHCSCYPNLGFVSDAKHNTTQSIGYAFDTKGYQDNMVPNYHRRGWKSPLGSHLQWVCTVHPR